MHFKSHQHFIELHLQSYNLGKNFKIVQSHTLSFGNSLRILCSHIWYASACVSSSECHVSLHCLCTMDDELFHCYQTFKIHAQACPTMLYIYWYTVIADYTQTVELPLSHSITIVSR